MVIEQDVLSALDARCRRAEENRGEVVHLLREELRIVLNVVGRLKELTKRVEKTADGVPASPGMTVYGPLAGRDSRAQPFTVGKADVLYYETPQTTGMWVSDLYSTEAALEESRKS